MKKSQLFPLVIRRETKFPTKVYLAKIISFILPSGQHPCCTAQACGFRDNYDFFIQKNILLFGISGDSAKSHENFIKKYNLPFPLIMDEDHSLARSFGVWGENLWVKHLKVFIECLFS